MAITLRRDVVKALLLSAAAALLSTAVLGAIVRARLRPTYVCAVVNGILASIAASSKMEGRWGKVGVVTAEARGADVAGKGEEMEKGLVEARPYEEVVEEVKSGAVPGACRVALPFGEVLDVDEDSGNHQEFQLPRLGGEAMEEAKPFTTQPKEENLNSSGAASEQRKATRILKAQQDEDLHEEEDEEDDLNRRVENFIDKFNQVIRSEKSGALQVY